MTATGVPAGKDMPNELNYLYLFDLIKREKSLPVLGPPKRRLFS
jgi:hypothetical protein